MNPETISGAEDPDDLERLACELRVAIEAMIALYPPVFSATPVVAHEGLIFVGEHEYFRSEARHLLRRLRRATYMQPTKPHEPPAELSTKLLTYPHSGHA